MWPLILLCATAQLPQATAPPTIAILADLTGSTDTSSSIPAIRSRDLTGLVECTVSRGGTLLVTAVQAEARDDIMRLKVPPPEPEPAAPALGTMGPLERRRASARFRGAHEAWRAGEARRVREAGREAQAFVKRVAALLDRPRNEQRSAVALRLTQLRTALAEPSGARQPCSVIIGSDLRDSNGERGPYHIPGCRVVLIDRHGSTVSQIRAEKVEVYESTKSAIDAVITGGT